MHIIATIRRDVYESESVGGPIAVRKLSGRRTEAYEDIRTTAALKAMLPWFTHHVEETEELMGANLAVWI